MTSKGSQTSRIWGVQYLFGDLVPLASTVNDPCGTDRPTQTGGPRRRRPRSQCPVQRPRWDPTSPAAVAARPGRMRHEKEAEVLEEREAASELQEPCRCLTDGTPYLDWFIWCPGTCKSCRSPFTLLLQWGCSGAPYTINKHLSPGIT